MSRIVRFHVPGDIEHPDAYRRAIEARIKNNARTTRSREWFAKHADAERLSDWLNERGEFYPTYSCGKAYELHDDDYRGPDRCNDPACYNKGQRQHSLCYGMYGGEFGKILINMSEALVEWGGLTDKQTDLVRRALARAEERLAKSQQRREERLSTDRATSQHIGTVGARVELTLRCEKVFTFEGIYGITYINLCRDEANNVVVYKGSNGFEEGETIKVKATIKAHEERDGVAQTLIARPKVL